MTDWRAILGRIQQHHSLTEIALVLGCDRQRLDNVKRGIEPKFEFGLRLLAVHDHVTGRDALSEATRDALARAGAEMKHAKRRSKAALCGVTTAMQDCE